MTRQGFKEAIYSWCCGGLFLVLGGPVAILGLVGGYHLFNQIHKWFRHGYWLPKSSREVFVSMGVLDHSGPIIEGWVGLNKIVEWFLSWHPLALAVVLGMLAIFLAVVIAEQIEEALGI